MVSMKKRELLTLCKDSDAAMDHCCTHSPLAGASACNGSPCSPGSYGNAGEGARRPLPSDHTHDTYYSAHIFRLAWCGLKGLCFAGSGSVHHASTTGIIVSEQHLGQGATSWACVLSSAVMCVGFYLIIWFSPFLTMPFYLNAKPLDQCNLIIAADGSTSAEPPAETSCSCVWRGVQARQQASTAACARQGPIGLDRVSPSLTGYVAWLNQVLAVWWWYGLLWNAVLSGGATSGNCSLCQPGRYSTSSGGPWLGAWGSKDFVY
jgi:hypothetical protein